MQKRRRLHGEPLPRLRVLAGASLLLVLLGGGCGRSVSSGECAALLERYTEKQIDQAKPSASTRQRTEMLRAVRVKAQLDPEYARCSDAVSRSQFECAMQADSADQMERCLL